MQGQKGASLESTRKIYRKMARSLAELRAIVERKRQRPGYDESKCLTAETVALLERQLSGSSPPVGALKGVWKQVCDEARARREKEAGHAEG
jgi:hypothetical protein